MSCKPSTTSTATAWRYWGDVGLGETVASRFSPASGWLREAYAGRWRGAVTLQRRADVRGFNGHARERSRGLGRVDGRREVELARPHGICLDRWRVSGGRQDHNEGQGFPASVLTVTRADSPSAWVDESRSPGIRMTFEHVIETSGTGTTLTERVRIDGPLEYVLGPLMRRRLQALFSASVTAVVREAESA